MPLTQEQLENYGDLVCSVKTLNNFLSSVKCNSDGTFNITGENGSCYNGKNISIDHLLQLMTIEALGGMSNSINTLEFPEPENCCDIIKEIYELLESFYTLVSNGLKEVTKYLAGIQKYFEMLEKYLANITEIIKKICDIFEKFFSIFSEFFEIFQKYFESSVSFHQKFNELFEQLSNYIETKKVVNFIPYNITRGERCFQRMALLYDDGTITTTTGNPININFVQRRVGYCCCP